MSDQDSLYPPNSCRNNQHEEIVWISLTKFSATLSILGSSYIIFLVLKKWWRKKADIDPYQRIMVFLSAYSVTDNFFHWFMGPWMTPVETGWFGAVGNTQSCTAQGFFLIFGWYGASLYQMALSLNMLLLVRYGWVQNKFEQKIEWWLHWIILFIALVLASIPLFFEGYNPVCGTCLMSSLPMGCGSGILGDGTTECVRGYDFLDDIFYILFLVSVGLATVFSTIAMGMVYASVRRQEKRTNQYRYNTQSHNRESRRIRGSLLLYTISFYICWVLPVIFWFAPKIREVLALQLIGAVLFPLHGFFNLLVYLRPKCQKYQKDHPGTWIITAYFRVILDCQCLNFCRLLGVADTLETCDEANDAIGFRTFNEDQNGCMGENRLGNRGETGLESLLGQNDDEFEEN